MVKVLIVDDEPIIRMGLQKVIHWESLGCKVIGVVGNGQEAMEKIEEEKPELIISDIKMPKMDGLEMVSRLGEKYPEIKIVLLTGYKEFEYAKKAVEFGVRDYILKPVDHHELEDVIRRAAGEIQHQKKERLEKEALSEKMMSSIPILRDKFITDLLFDSPETIQHVYERLEYFGISLGDFILILIETECTGDSRFLGECMQQLVCFITEQFKRLSDVVVIPFIRGKKIYCIVNGGKEKLPNRELIMDCIRQLEKRLYDFGGLEVYVGISQPYHGPFFLKKAREEAEEQIAGLPAERIPSRNTFTVEQAVTYMRENSNRAVSLEEVAEHVYMSKWYFCKQFKKETGVNFNDYVAKLRIEQAQKCIRDNPALRNYEVAAMMGFGNVRYFSQLFKKVTGMTPSEFRG